MQKIEITTASDQIVDEGVSLLSKCLLKWKEDKRSYKHKNCVLQWFPFF